MDGGTCLAVNLPAGITAGGECSCCAGGRLALTPLMPGPLPGAYLGQRSAPGSLRRTWAATPASIVQAKEQDVQRAGVRRYVSLFYHHGMIRYITAP